MTSARRVFMTEHGHLWWETRPGLFTHSMWWETARTRSEYAPDGSSTNWPYVRLAAEATLTDVTARYPEINAEAGA